jgi:heterodisulfide reductase subunit B2
MKYGLFPGCNMPVIRPDVERAIRLTMPPLGVDLVDLPGYVCCPAFGTFPSLDEEAHLAVSAWNLSLGEDQDVDLLVECGSCYSSLTTGRDLLARNEKTRERVAELLGKAGKTYRGDARARHITDVLYNEVGLEKIRGSLTHTLEGLKAVIQYPCHTLHPSETVGFDPSPSRPRILAELTEALGAEVLNYSREMQCCGGAGGFRHSSHEAACEFTRQKFDSIIDETDADFIVVSCITCLMHLDDVQKELSEGNGKYAIPVFDYSQLLALCMGMAPAEVASISTTPRDDVVSRIVESCPEVV